MKMMISTLVSAVLVAGVLLYAFQLDIGELLMAYPNTVDVSRKEDVAELKLKDGHRYMVCYIPGGSGNLIKSIMMTHSIDKYWNMLLKMAFKNLHDVYLGDHSAAMLIIADSMEYYIFLDMYKNILYRPSDETICETHDGAFVPLLNAN
jgi:hypothetical protein